MKTRLFDTTSNKLYKDFKFKLLEQLKFTFVRTIIHPNEQTNNNQLDLVCKCFDLNF